MGHTLLRKTALLFALAAFGSGFTTAAGAVTPVECPAVVALECSWRHGSSVVTAVNKADPADNPADIVPGVGCSSAINELLDREWDYLTDPVTSAFGAQTHVFFCRNVAG
jgi:hypothetical protein